MIKPEQTYQQLIFEGIQMLPPDALAEIVDFILFAKSVYNHNVLKMNAMKRCCNPIYKH